MFQPYKMKKILFFLFLSLSLSAQNVFKASEIKSRLEKATKWQLENPKHEPTDWTNGAFYAGVFAAWEATQKQWIMDSLMNLGKKTSWQPGNRYDHADDITISQTYIDLYRQNKNEKLIKPTWDTLIKVQFWPGKEKANHGITWWWCDALFMGPPVFAKIAKETGDISLLKTNDELFKECYDLLYNKEEKLFARDASYLKDAQGNQKLEANGQKIFWSRGNGWVIGGLARLLAELPSDYPNRSFYETLFKEMAYRLKSLQQPDGLWRSSLLDPDAYPGGEASGSGFDIYAITWGVNHGLLPEKDFKNTIRNGWKALNTLVQENGKVGWVQPIGADPRRNFDKESWEVYGTGAYLLAGSEMLKYLKK
ncbi:MAG: glycoside hydrolase family 88 protein [Cytophagaceae bacterium]|nr:glycoside hydrolase family 88 protein [Cytophagaceae bacterium]MBL0301171.1 glycoside hydrolase family 88 protein [Cytophagaceae bacterium]MBL0323988.1 glycoside hydrolase family 88 protein [Cytophagaceae bacterium]